MPQGLVPREKGLPRSSEEAPLGRRVQWPEDRQRGKDEEPGAFPQASGPGWKWVTKESHMRFFVVMGNRFE